MIVLTFLLFLFLSFLCSFFFFLLLSYVFADGELNFNYFAVEVKSCFMNIKSFPSQHSCFY